MCRRNQMSGCCLLALGIGLLLGKWISSTFFCVACASGLILLGYFILCRK